MLSIDAFLPSILTIDELSVKVESHALFFAFELYPPIIILAGSTAQQTGSTAQQTGRSFIFGKRKCSQFPEFFSVKFNYNKLKLNYFKPLIIK